MRDIGIYICNYNKREMVVKCVEHILNQTVRVDCDIYVVDNASDDGSVEALERNYNDEITIIKNEDNIGGAGGFGRGIEDALQKNYKYLMLVDNDAMLNVDVVEILRKYIDNNSDVGICGAKTVKLQQSNEIQDMGGRLDYSKYDWFGIMQNEPDLDIDIIMDVDYVASCSCMARVSAVKEFGGFPIENFIYWDDVEWCTKCREAGYRVVVNGNAIAKHDFSKSGIDNQFFRYYCTRNRFRYFAKYLPDDKLDDFWNKITEEIYTKICTFNAKGMSGGSSVILSAFEDFLDGITGRQSERIIPLKKVKPLYEKKISIADTIIIYMQTHDASEYDKVKKIVKYIKTINVDAQILVKLMEDYFECDRKDTVQIVICNHVKRVKNNILPAIYMDGWLNAIATIETYELFVEFSKGLEDFRLRYQEKFNNRLVSLRKSQ